MTHETAGDPVALKWTRRTTAKLADVPAHPRLPADRRGLLKAMGYSGQPQEARRRLIRTESSSSTSPPCASAAPPTTAPSSASIRRRRSSSARSAIPAPSGTAAPNSSTTHPTPTAAPCPTASTTPAPTPVSTADTPAFAVDCIEKWWRTEGRKRYPEAKTLQILADGGGSNSCTARAWKFNLQHRFHGLPVRVAHYPPAPKWNPIAPPVLRDQQELGGRPLDSFETILKYLRTTRTSTGLRVRAHLVRKTYETGVKVTDAQMRELRITPNSVLPKWNYTIEP